MSKQRVFRTKIKDVVERAMIKELIDYGEMVMKEAYATHEFKNRTYNLHDSYGSAVYKDGVYVNGSLRTLEPQASESVRVGSYYVKGKNEVARYLRDEYRPKKRGLSLVVVAAMPYAETLEEGEGLRRKYKVISGARWMMESLAKSFSAKFGVQRGGININSITI